jgi:hypothetical protein
MDKYKHVIGDPYNGGVITMSNWEVVNDNGLHQAMFTKEEHERLSQIVSGKGKKFTVRKTENKFFGLNNVGVCEDCINTGLRATLVGYNHNNGKKGNSLKFYDRYRCRVCNKSRLRSVVHEGANKLFDGVEFIEPKVDSLKKDLKKAWREEMNDNTQVVARLKQKLRILEDKKDKLILAMATEPDLAEDIKTSIIGVKTDIVTLKSEINTAENADKDFEEFIEFSLDFVDNMKNEFWDLEQADKQRCKELLFPGEIVVARSGKVYTSELSKLLRYRPTKKAPLKELTFMNGGPGGT